MSEEVDLLIVGAGWNGLTMAKTYHEASPKASMMIMDSNDSPGGTWAQERLYPTLKTNNVVGSFEFSDFPMNLEEYGVQPGQHIPGQVMHRYLCDAAKHFDIEQYLCLGTKVDCARLRDDELWEVTYRSTTQPSAKIIIARKLVLAFGLTTEPQMPSFPGQDGFEGLLTHSKELPKYSEKLAQTRNVVVIGGNKSAWDTCYTIARSGGTAHMVMRTAGGGPTRAFPKLFSFLGGVRTLFWLAQTRLVTLFDPWPFNTSGSMGRGIVRWLLHKTRLGRMITTWFWRHFDKQLAMANGYDVVTGAKRLEPWCSTFWLGCSLSSLNYETNFFEEIRKGSIVVHHAEVLHLDRNSVSLSDGKIADVDAVVSCTGWSSRLPIYIEPPELEAELGLPQDASVEDEELLGGIRRQILTERPSLAEPPRAVSGEESPVESSAMTPYRLYRFVIPSSERFLGSKNIAFIGINYALHVVSIAQAQALWITAFFNDEMPHLQTEKIDYVHIAHQTLLHTEYERLRHPRTASGFGEKFPDLVFDSLPYIDMLLSDVGMQARRKASIWNDFMKPHSLRNYEGLVREWRSERK